MTRNIEWPDASKKGGPWTDPSTAQCVNCGRKIALEMIADGAKERREWQQRAVNAELTLASLHRKTPRGFLARLWLLFVWDGVPRW